jgi:hypothetical protein
MRFLTRLFPLRAMHSQRQVAERAAYVIEQVIFDMGVDRLVCGTVQLDRHCRPHFFGAEPLAARRAQATVPLARLAESAALRCAVGAVGDPQALRPHTRALVEGLLREFHTQSARFRALPAARDA